MAQKSRYDRRNDKNGDNYHTDEDLTKDSHFPSILTLGPLPAACTSAWFRGAEILFHRGFTDGQ